MLLRIICFIFWINLINACYPGANLGLSYPGYGSYQPAYMHSYNGYPASYGVPFKSRHEASTDTKTALMANNDPSNGCVTEFDNSRLTCATPFERRPLSTPSDCQKLCFENILKCQSFEFNTLTATCDLFNVPPPEGVMEAAKNPKFPFSDEPLKDKDEFSYRVKRQFNPLDQQDPLKLPQFPNYCEPEVVPAIGTIFYVPNLDCAPSNQFISSPSNNNLEPLNNNHHRLPPSVSAVIPTSGTNGAKIIPEMTDCRDGGRARIQLIDGIAFVPERSSVARIQVDSADVCLLLCRNNAYLDGTRFQRPCIAATFDRGTGRCTIMNEAITPNGQLQYTPHADSVYFEKMCIPVGELPLNCDDVVHRIPQRVLEGQADATIDASNQIDCIRRCITASRLLGFTCQSATYYFEFPVQNCILNRFTRTSRPNSFAAELRQKVDYMEMAPCMIIDWQQRDVAWSEWSDCNQTSVKTRKRNCTNCDKQKETISCVHPKNSEFPIITKNTEADLIPVQKQIVTNFDTAKNLRKQEMKNIPDDEKSLFGENDYENQHEVSYFGPPRNEQKINNDLLDSSKIEDITDDAVKELEKAAMREARNHHHGETTSDNEIPKLNNNRLRSTKDQTYDTNNDLNLGEGIGIVEFPTKNNQENINFEGLRKLSDQVTTTTTTTTEKPLNLKPVQIGPIPVTDSMENCNPKKDCCPLIDIRGRKSRGCTLGYKINSKNQQEGCVPDECRHKNGGFTVYI